jgi:hypothetical protein
MTLVRSGTFEKTEVTDSHVVPSAPNLNYFSISSFRLTSSAQQLIMVETRRLILTTASPCQMSSIAISLQFSRLCLSRPLRARARRSPRRARSRTSKRLFALASIEISAVYNLPSRRAAQSTDITNLSHQHHSFQHYDPENGRRPPSNEHMPFPFFSLQTRRTSYDRHFPICEQISTSPESPHTSTTDTPSFDAGHAHIWAKAGQLDVA